MTIQNPAPAGGVTFQVTSCNLSLSAPDPLYVTIPQGQTSATFTAYSYSLTGTVTYQVGEATADLTITD